MIAYLDASALIYLIEGAPALVKRVRTRLRELAEAAADVRIAVGRLAWPECRVGPMKTGDTARLTTYGAFFARPDLIRVELSADVVDLAMVIRARHGLKTPDALHAASCLQPGSGHVFLTGDAAFRRVDGLHVAVVS